MNDLNSSSARIFSRVVADEPDAASQLFQRYLKRLCRLAQTRIGTRLARRVDPEDVVMSAYRSFFLSAQAGRFKIQESGDLWALLARITLRKLYRSAAHHAAEMRSVHREAEFSDSRSLNEWVLSEQPSVEDAVALADEVESILRKLPPLHRRIVELRLQGELTADIATDVDLSERTVRRILSELETEMRRSHGEHEQDTIRIVAQPTTTEINEPHFLIDTIHRFSFSDLKLKKLIGAGGMGKVYHAISLINGEPVAVKFLHKSLQNSPQVIAQFLSEAAAIQKLNHPGLVQFKGIGKTKADIWFIVMELLDGHSLAEEIAARVPTIDEAIFWVGQVAESLAVVHAANIVHCDLKPANVLLTPAGRAVVTDFGLSRQSVSTTFSEQAVAGSAPWMAPEQIDPVFGSIDHRTDLYGLGALLYTLLAGQPPFFSTRIPDVLAMVLSQSPMPIAQLRPDVPPQIGDLCMQCLSKNPEHRPGSATEFFSRLHGRNS